MMRCTPFVYRAPTTVDEAVRILGGEGAGAMVLAGGTDVVPNMKRRQQTPATLVSLRRVAGLRDFTAVDGADRGMRLGAALTLRQLAGDARLSAWQALGRAASSVATPHIRNVGTLGGNLCLDTRCNYYDQSFEWRKAIDFCMKKEGTVCWVAPGSPRCWAVSSTDTAPALMALDAEVTLVSTRGARNVRLDALYQDDGIDYIARRPDELLTDVTLAGPGATRQLRSTYWKLRRREAFDFPVLSVAIALWLDQGGRTVTRARIVFGGVGSRPVPAADAAALLIDRTLDDNDLLDEVAAAASRLAKPLDNTDYSIGWRKRVAQAYVRGALAELRGDDPATLGLLARRATALRPLI